MAAPPTFLAFDLGAESGRALAGHLNGDHLVLEEVHRFSNAPVAAFDGLYWDVLRLWGEVKTGLSAAGHRYGATLAGVGLDTWGVDFALLDRNGTLLGNPYHYRDRRTDGMMPEAFRRVPCEEIYEQTGTQFMQLNTLYQLLAMALSQSPQLEAAQRLLMIPDLFNYWLTGRQACELTEATTSQCFDVRAQDWARGLLERLGIRSDIFGPVVPPATVLAPLHPSVGEETNLGPVPVIAPACHDTQSAIAAVPASEDSFAYISSGTWSLKGIEVDGPIINASSLAAGFTNEGGVEGTISFLRNITGLWLVQECRRAWLQAGENYTYPQLIELAAREAPFGSMVDPDDPVFLHPGDMPARMCAFCQRTGQRVPESKGQLIRCALESLALKYRFVLQKLEELGGRRLESIHIVGGGSQNALLCQWTADACNRPVVAGPVEATATGNILLQARAVGLVGSLAELRRVVRASFPIITYEPHPSDRWDEQFERYRKLLDTSSIASGREDS